MILLPDPFSRVLTIRSDTTIREAVKILSANNFSCAPVIDASKASIENVPWQEKYLGMFFLCSFMMLT